MCVCVWNNLVLCFPEVFQQTKLYFIKKKVLGSQDGWKRRKGIHLQPMHGK